jgi:hypothetical protein
MGEKKDYLFESGLSKEFAEKIFEVRQPNDPNYPYFFFINDNNESH